ncbi:unnamed protein product [Prorocentrum cordatum]|uniref:PRA1 family protein n=1 Tax=Prorocentrum cordatum TaxID=2364126 RepID=A0ABN9UX22_9DINO|nr:unnamed protein product [Polarella glacialis]
MGDGDDLAMDMEFDSAIQDFQPHNELDSFFSGGVSQGTVSLQPSAATLGSPTAAALGAAEARGAAAAHAGAGAAAAASQAAPGAAAGGLLGGALSSAAGPRKLAGAAVPASLLPEAAGRLLSDAQPWRGFLLPLSKPPPGDYAARLTANLSRFKTNYAVLFVVTLTAAILFDPSALVCVVFVAAAWALFLKKNADPDWAPVVGGIALGPTQRWLILACGTALLLFLVAGTVIIHAALLYAAAALVHGVLHDPSDCHETILGGRHPRLMVPL